MGQILHKCARTTEITRKEIQESQESITFLAKKYGVSRPTIYKWKNSSSCQEKKSGPARDVSVLTQLEQQIICEFRRVTKLSYRECFFALKPEIPRLSQSNLLRCLKKNGLNVLPNLEEKTSKKRGEFKKYPLGFSHIDTTEIILGDKQKSYIFIGIERNSKFAFAKVYQNKTIETSAEFLTEYIEKMPFKIHTILTDNGIEYTFNLLAKPTKKVHQFDQICEQNNIKHKCTKFAHPWTNGQVERFNRTFKEATTKKYFYQNRADFSRHLAIFLEAYNFGKRLGAINFLTPLQKLIDFYNKDKLSFKEDFNVNEFTKLNS